MINDSIIISIMILVFYIVITAAMTKVMMDKKKNQVPNLVIILVCSLWPVSFAIVILYMVIISVSFVGKGIIAIYYLLPFTKKPKEEKILA